MQRFLLVVTSLDVEEEGLFSGKYPAVNPGVSNVACLDKLAPLSGELGFPLTLFCAHSVFTNAAACEHVDALRQKYSAEIGAHLHHWSTPPANKDKAGPPERTDKLDRRLLEERLKTLLAAGGNFCGAPIKSFRMGRWDLKASLLPLLAECKIQVDSSICPLRAFADGPNHFMAPADPYWITLPEEKRILEAPITQIPLFKGLPRLWSGLAPNKLDLYHFFGALSVNPFWHGSFAMKLAAMLHYKRGGKVINLFWHSSEMMPGGSPHVPDMAARDRMLQKIYEYLRWLKNTFPIKAITAKQLADPEYGRLFPKRNLERGRDW